MVAMPAEVKRIANKADPATNEVFDELTAALSGDVVLAEVRTLPDAVRRLPE